MGMLEIPILLFFFFVCFCCLFVYKNIEDFSKRTEYNNWRRSLRSFQNQDSNRSPGKIHKHRGQTDLSKIAQSDSERKNHLKKLQIQVERGGKSSTLGSVDRGLHSQFNPAIVRFTQEGKSSTVTESPNKSNRAIVSILIGPMKEKKYMSLLRSFEVTLRKSGYEEDIYVLVTPDVVLRDYISQITSIKFIQVDKISSRSGHEQSSHYASLFTKIAIFNLEQFDRVIYYDLDFIFQSNPITAYASCGTATLCACQDIGMTREMLKESDLETILTPSKYFNAGFIVLKPNKKVYDDLMALIKSPTELDRTRLQTYKFAEQDLLNVYFKDKWKDLDKSYNLMHIQAVSLAAVAIHEKLWILQEKFPDPNYLWNDERIPRLDNKFAKLNMKHHKNYLN